MMTRTGTCSCGQLRVTCEGEPIRVSLCHCTACQKRGGGPFGVVARWDARHVRVAGTANQWARSGDSGGVGTFRFCPTCGTTVYYTSDMQPDVIAVPIGQFADASIPGPSRSVYEERKHPWVVLPSCVTEHMN